MVFSQTTEYSATQLVSSIKHKLSHAIYCTQIVNNFNYLAASTVQVMLLYRGAGRLVPLVVFSSFHYSGKEFLQTFTPSRELAVLIISFLLDPAILASKEIA